MKQEDDTFFYEPLEEKIPEEVVKEEPKIKKISKVVQNIVAEEIPKKKLVRIIGIQKNALFYLDNGKKRAMPFRKNVSIGDIIEL